MKNASLLIVDDDQSFTRAATELARQCGFQATTVTTVREGRERIGETHFDAALIDLQLPDGDGFQLLNDLDLSLTQTILISGFPTLESALDTANKPIVDYILKPLNPDHFCQLLTVAFDRRRYIPPAGTADRHGLVGGRALDTVRHQIDRVARIDSPVLIVGESGTGKEIVARAIHDASQRPGPFVPVNMAALAGDLLASQLFGHEKGSFTGADRRHIGFFEEAREGTLFLDEITEMPLHLQAHLLRALEANVIRRVGGGSDIKVDVRIVSATNRSPEDAMRDGALREDLFYRIAEFPLHLPALWQRADDVPMLAQMFLDRLNARYGDEKFFSERAIHSLKGHHWPGNVRELRNVVQRAYILADAKRIEVQIDNPQTAAPSGETPGSLTFAIGTRLDEIEKQVLLRTLEHCNNNKVLAADILGLSVKTIYNRLARYEADGAVTGAGDNAQTRPG